MDKATPDTEDLDQIEETPVFCPACMSPNLPEETRLGGWGHSEFFKCRMCGWDWQEKTQ